MVKTPKIPKELKNLTSNTLFIVLVIVAQVALLFVGKHLWNKYLVDTVTFIKPLRIIIHLLAIIFLVKIIFY